MMPRIAILLVGLASQLGVSAHAETIRLLCAAANGQYPQVVDVDFGVKTVNGWKATITDAEIKWASEELFLQRPEVRDNTINRLNGQYSSRARNVVVTGLGPSIICQKAPAPKF